MLPPRDESRLRHMLDYAEEALGHSGAVPASLRLELEPERAEAAATDFGALDFDFSPIEAAEAVETAASEPPPAGEDQADLLESMDLSTLFEQDMGEVTPEDMLLKLQQDLHHGFVSNAFGPAAYAVYAVGCFKVPLIGILRESVGSVVLLRINELESRNDKRRILELVATAARCLHHVMQVLHVTRP